MGDKVTHLGFLGAKQLRQGGMGKALKGAQPLAITRPTAWYPQNLPAATLGTPQDSDIKLLLDSLAPLVAQLVMAQSVILGCCFKSVQSGVLPGGSFSLNAVSSGATNSFFDSGLGYSESVQVDVVNKNPALTYDLAVRLAAQVAARIDTLGLTNYSTWSNASVGAASTTPTLANIQAAIASLPATGEPILGLFSPNTVTALKAASVIKNAELNAIAGTKPFRVIATDGTPTTGTATVSTHNQMLVPSALAICSADIGTQTNTTGNTYTVSGIPGNVQTRASIYLDPETAVPQLALQLVMGNSGAGNQTIYVNGMIAALVLNAAGGVQVLS